MNLDQIPAEVLMARGQYATVRGAHEDEKKRLSILCGQLSSASSQVLRYMQPGDDESPKMAAVLDLILIARRTTDQIEQCVQSIEQLAIQRAALKQPAWGKF